MHVSENRAACAKHKRVYANINTRSVNERNHTLNHMDSVKVYHRVAVTRARQNNHPVDVKINRFSSAFAYTNTPEPNHRFIPVGSAFTQK